MTKKIFLEQFERRLVELDFPARLLRRKLDELATHFDFLHQTGVKDGWSEPQADAYATQELGNPVALAEQTALERRQACWWGRHRILGYIVLPLVALGPAFIATMFSMMLVIMSRMTMDQFNSLFNTSNGLRDQKSFLMALYSMHYFAMTLLPLPFRWMARRAAVGLKWATVPCVICAAQGMFLYPIITSRNLNMGYHWTPNLIGGLGPLLLIAAAYWRQYKALQRLPELPESGSPRRLGLAELLQTPLGSVRPGLPRKLATAPSVDFGALVKKWLRTPTYWIVALIPVLILMLMMAQHRDSMRRRSARLNQNAAAAPTSWTAERDATAEEVRARQATSETTHETTISLQPFINAQLSESTDGGKKGLKENSLLELPAGRHIYGGVPFDVQGRIQLMGKGLEKWDLTFPAAVRDIKIGRKCEKIFLFHGENCNMNSQFRGTVARLVLHYRDGSEQQIEIKTGEHLLDWWGATHTTGVMKNRRFVSSPDSELAWVGSNAWIKKYQPQMSLRLYKSTFKNPQPEVEIESVDYVSAMTGAAPFMVGLTVE